MTNFIDEEELEGRTVEKVLTDFGSNITIVFTDGTWTNIRYNSGHYPGEGDVEFDAWRAGEFVEKYLKEKNRGPMRCFEETHLLEDDFRKQLEEHEYKFVEVLGDQECCSGLIGVTGKLKLRKDSIDFHDLEIVMGTVGFYNDRIVINSELGNKFTFRKVTT